MPTRLPSDAVLLYQSKFGSIERVSLKVQPVETVLFVPRRVAVVLLLPRGEDGAVLLCQSVLSRVMASQERKGRDGQLATKLSKGVAYYPPLGDLGAEPGEGSWV